MEYAKLTDEELEEEWKKVSAAYFAIWQERNKRNPGKEDPKTQKEASVKDEILKKVATRGHGLSGAFLLSDGTRMITDGILLVIIKNDEKYPFISFRRAKAVHEEIYHSLMGRSVTDARKFQPENPKKIREELSKREKEGTTIQELFRKFGKDASIRFGYYMEAQILADAEKVYKYSGIGPFAFYGSEFDVFVSHGRWSKLEKCKNGIITVKDNDPEEEFQEPEQ